MAKAKPGCGGCPCGSKYSYAQCCKPLHDGAPAADVEALMRSRYSAYALSLVPYLLQSWHESTRPALREADLDPATRWLGLRIVRHSVDPDDSEAASVEFIARYRIGGGSAQRLHERSRFLRVDGYWRYLDGEMLEPQPEIGPR